MPLKQFFKESVSCTDFLFGTDGETEVGHVTVDGTPGRWGWDGDQHVAQSWFSTTSKAASPVIVPGSGKLDFPSLQVRKEKSVRVRGKNPRTTPPTI